MKTEKMKKKEETEKMKKTEEELSEEEKQKWERNLEIMEENDLFN